MYVDNLGVMSTSRRSVAQALSEAVEVFDGAGLATHEQEIKSGDAGALGVLLDGVRAESRTQPAR